MRQPTSQRRLALTLLPLALLGLLPAWAVLLLCVLYAAGVRHAEWVQARLLGSLLIVGLVPLPALLTLNVSDLRSVTGVLLVYGLCTGAAAALHWAAGELEDGHRRGLVPVVLVGLLAPQPGLVLALLGGLMARPGPDSRHAPNVPWSAGVWRGIFLAAGAAVVLTAFLPRPGLNPAAWLDPAPTSVAAKPNVPPPPPPTAPASEGEGDVGRGLPVDLVLASPVADRLLEAGGPLLLLLAVLVLIAVMRERGGGKPGKRHPAQVLMVAGLLLTLALWLVAGLLLSVGGERGGDPLLGGAALKDALGKLAAGLTGAGDRASVNITAGALALLWALVGLTVLGILGVATHLLRTRRRLTAEVTDPVEASVPAESASLQAVHRVRIAYAHAEQALAATGRVRAAAETPDGFAVRLTAQDPALGSPLDILTRAYLPVRYGGDLTDQDAAAAEQAVQDLTRLLPTLPTRVPNLGE